MCTPGPRNVLCSWQAIFGSNLQDPACHAVRCLMICIFVELELLGVPLTTI